MMLMLIRMLTVIFEYVCMWQRETHLHNMFRTQRFIFFARKWTKLGTGMHPSVCPPGVHRNLINLIKNIEFIKNTLKMYKIIWKYINVHYSALRPNISDQNLKRLATEVYNTQGLDYNTTRFAILSKIWSRYHSQTK